MDGDNADGHTIEVPLISLSPLQGFCCCLPLLRFCCVSVFDVVVVDIVVVVDVTVDVVYAAFVE